MGFFDNVASAVNRGTASVQRTGRTTQLKLQLSELMKRRRDMAAQLGASLYEVAREMPELREGRELLFDGIEDIDKKRAAIEAEIAEIEASVAADARTCAKCGAPLGDEDMFCMSCGSKAEPAKSVESAEEPGSSGKHTANAECTFVADPKAEAAETFEEAPEAGADEAAEAEMGDGLSVKGFATGFCPHCGNQVSSADSFCATCGTQVRL